MKLPNTSLSGIYCNDSDDDLFDDYHNNLILIYQDEAQQLVYNYSLHTEDDHNRRSTFEEGFVHLQSTSRELHFEVQHRYEWSAGDPSSWCRSTTYQPQQAIQIFRMLDQAEIASIIKKKLLISDRPEVVILRHEREPVEIESLLVEGAPIYERIDSDEDFQYKSTNLEAEVVAIRERLHKHWQDMIKEHIHTRLAAGISPEEIAQECVWTTEAIRAFQEKDRGFYQNMTLSGMYICCTHPYDSDVDDDIILIYQDEAQRLSYNYLYRAESNHGIFSEFKEGLVHLAASGYELHFEVQRRYKWGAGWDSAGSESWCRSTTFQPRQSIQTFHLFDETEIASAIRENIISKETKVAISTGEGKDIYERVGDKRYLWNPECQEAKKVVATRKRLHEHWQDMLKEHVRSQLAQRLSPEEIASSCDWTVQSIRDLRSPKTKRSATKKKKK